MVTNDYKVVHYLCWLEDDNGAALVAVLPTKETKSKRMSEYIMKFTTYLSVIMTIFFRSKSKVAAIVLLMDCNFCCIFVSQSSQSEFALHS